MNTIIERIIKETIAEQNVYPSRSLLSVLEDVCVRYQYPIKNVLIFTKYFKEFNSFQSFSAYSG